jgi:protein-S-isoprenylcysteine O-methyltransferase Ste14
MYKQIISKAGSIAGLIVAVCGMLYLLRTNCLLSTNYIGIGIQVLAAGLMIWARLTFGMRSFHAVANTTEGGLVTNGPYKFFRHPIYASIIYFVWAAVLSYPRIDTAVAGVLVCAGLITRMLLEETFLRVTYRDYENYSRRTKRIIPFIF